MQMTKKGMTCVTDFQYLKLYVIKKGISDKTDKIRLTGCNSPNVH